MIFIPPRPVLRLAAAAVVIPALAPAIGSAEPWRFVSTPDFVNADVFDITSSPYNTSGYNSTNAAWETALSSFLGKVKAENPDFVMVAGDLSMQRWTLDAYEKGVFGPKLGTAAYNNGSTTLDPAIEIARVELASDLYYPQWVQRFDAKGLKVYAAVGDHELGDDEMWRDYNPDRVPAGTLEVSRQTIPTLRAKFGEYLVDPLRNGSGLAANSTFVSSPGTGQHSNSAYAIKHNNALIVTVDIFKQLADPDTSLPGDLAYTVDGQQLTWLQNTLDNAAQDPSIDHIIVQGHSPVIGSNLPNRNSSRLYLDDGTSSALWQTLKSKGVDLYLAGEFHDISLRQDGNHPLLQLVHGAAWGFSNIPTVNYLVGEVDGDVMKLTLKEYSLTADGGALFQARGGSSVRANVVLGDTATIRGTLTIDKSGTVTQYSNASGVFTGAVNPPVPPTPPPPVAPLAPNDPSIASRMQLWLKDAQTDFIQGAGSFDAQWLDSSGQGNHLVAYAGRSLSGGGTNTFSPANAEPTVRTVTVPVQGGNNANISVVSFADNADELMRAQLDPNSGSGMNQLTMFMVYRANYNTDAANTRPGGIGSFRDLDNGANTSSSNQLNLAVDGTIRKDNGSLGSVAHPDELFLIRTVRMSPTGGVDQWFHVVDLNLQQLLANGTAFTTRDADFFLGDLRTSGLSLAGDWFDIAEVIVYDAALTDAQIAGVDAHLYQKYFVPEPVSASLLVIGGALLRRPRRTHR